MKNVTRYEIRSFSGNEYSRPMFHALLDRKSAQRVVRWLKKRGHQAFIAPVRVSA